MSIILGLNCLHSDTAACLVKDNKLLFAIEEERINREKHTSKFPLLSIKECLKQTNIRENEITHIALNTQPKSNLLEKINFLVKNFNFKNNLTKRLNAKIKIENILRNELNLNGKVKFVFVEHHLAHISSAYYASNFKDAIGLSIDGSGDFASLMVAECSKGSIKVLKKIFFPDSLGIFYHAMTQFLGFKNFGDEYKLMGLAPYGKPIYFDKIIDNLFQNSKNFFKLDLKYFNHHKINFNYSYSNGKKIPNIYSHSLKKLFRNEIKNNSFIFKKNFAASVQKVYELYFHKILKNIRINENKKNLVFAGGCALNSSANKFLLSSKFKKKVFIPFAPGDNGGCLGAAFYVSNKLNKKNNFNDPYLGNSYSHDQIKCILKNEFLKKIKFRSITKKNKYEIATKIIINNGVIGWFQNKMEFGPRALGNRSILADPRNPKVKDLINKKIKRRENFRPFAPSVLSDKQFDWFEEKFDNIYMSSVMTPKKNRASLIPGVVHVDNTSRVQTVHKNINKDFYDLIHCFYLKTNIPILLNTSFNENEPIVRTPQEAINCFLRTKMDAHFNDNFYITKLR